MSHSPPNSVPIAQQLLGIFYDRLDDWGKLSPVHKEEIPQPHRRLLAHDEHMTVMLEAHHVSLVDVQVLRVHDEGGIYSREILLSRQRDGTILQYGIPRLRLACLPETAQARLRAQQTPLGRLLVTSDVLRHVELVQLWKIQAGRELARLFSINVDEITWGRSALIHVNGEPAVELLEVLSPFVQ